MVSKNNVIRCDVLYSICEKNQFCKQVGENGFLIPNYLIFHYTTMRYIAVPGCIIGLVNNGEGSPASEFICATEYNECH